MTSRHYYFVENFKIVEKQLCKLTCSYGKVSHALEAFNNKWQFFRNFSGEFDNTGPSQSWPIHMLS